MQKYDYFIRLGNGNWISFHGDMKYLAKCSRSVSFLNPNSWHMTDLQDLLRTFPGLRADQITKMD